MNNMNTQLDQCTAEAPAGHLPPQANACANYHLPKDHPIQEDGAKIREQTDRWNKELNDHILKTVDGQIKLMTENMRKAREMGIPDKQILDHILLRPGASVPATDLSGVQKATCEPAKMTNERFENIVFNRLEILKQRLFEKAKEYSFNNDRLHNFKVSAAMQGISVPKAAYGISSKHFVSILDLVNGDLPATSYNITEKITDAMAYLLLIEATLTQ